MGAMKTLKAVGAVAALSLPLLFAGAPAKAEIIINNIFSPFSTVEIVQPRHYGSGYRAWIYSPNHHARCYRRWHAYYQEWSFECRRMDYGGGPYERGGYYESGYYGGGNYRY